MVSKCRATESRQPTNQRLSHSPPSQNKGKSCMNTIKNQYHLDILTLNEQNFRKII